jgi:hypothetical protein
MKDGLAQKEEEFAIIPEENGVLKKHANGGKITRRADICFTDRDETFTSAVMGRFKEDKITPTGFEPVLPP